MKLIYLLLFTFSLSYASVVTDYLNSLENEVKKENSNFKGFDKKRGEKIFTAKHLGKKGKEISCVSCHTNNFTQNGENIFTGKVIKPLSPKVNPKRLSELKTMKKWLKRNFKDVYVREGTALEKGDVITYILSKD
ncbi:DUF1924 domain-containing protein [Poseidonibacter ostreae]|uniref:DUF1924 domain-containing protein n=1 Tax=Poseidonibacter ostreae TaxID=2654171 RepID=A0ABQ6VQ45_9BACT|nr:DUF1924 domain-containing protein [Poseidonibacter ostreae]KAB7884508.1 DUF1924 domain-containing protein [Poseidonibacter ostreae]KAB7892902.1 DUF1924 domain-containing protein [Poseidonibacter ostreae]MAC82762.1 hypothetical protein [Arcobacter sp.]